MSSVILTLFVILLHCAIRNMQQFFFLLNYLETVGCIEMHVMNEVLRNGILYKFSIRSFRLTPTPKELHPPRYYNIHNSLNNSHMG